MADPVLRIGLTGTALAALCCLTPVLPLVLGAIGAGSLVASLYRDAVLLPILGIFMLTTGYALWRRKKRS
ncbi:mercury resistance system transport protein MerF [Jannaschia faecimaris]|uniref:mercury resistance system transport protein MerF n=1 Tax=Jannaschia faecimaris TaxID=1244108 RepID=UPI000B88F43E|nr:mercury resistance system transport protein MerF [Jannaschia faecimaris]